MQSSFAFTFTGWLLSHFLRLFNYLQRRHKVSSVAAVLCDISCQRALVIVLICVLLQYILQYEKNGL